MAATVAIWSVHTGDSTTDVSANGMRFKLADNDTEDLSNPCRIPTADQVAANITFTYSYIKFLKLFITGEPENTISNLRFFTDQENGEMGTGITLLADSTWAEFDDAAVSDNDSTGDYTCQWLIVSGDQSQHFWTKASPQVVNAGTVYTNGDEVIGDGLQAPGNQNFVTVQIRIGSTALPGSYPSGSTRTFTYRYDEN